MSKRKSNFPLRSNEKMVASIATHFEKEQYLTFVERTLAATGFLGDVYSIIIHILYFYIPYD